MRTAFLTFAVIAVMGAAAQASPPPRVWDSWTHKTVGFDAMVDSLAGENVVIVGEIHDSAAGHAAELRILDGLIARRKAAALGLEMFERDTQVALDDYLSGRIAEETFLARSRPWPNYAAAYKPLVEAAKAAAVPVVATNVPRSLAAAVAKSGVTALAALPADHLWLFARHTTAPQDAYWTDFSETMKEHVDVSSLTRYYAAQCLKDDTMAESIADWFERHAPVEGVFLHINGAFHSDHNLGLFARLRERMPKARIASVRIVPLEKPTEAEAAAWEKTADWVVFVEK
jgi:uncharacterized iron-regulated protein